MKLKIAERFALLSVIPDKGNAATLRILNELRNQLSLTEQELEHYSIKNSTLPDGRVNVTWNPELSNETKDIEIGKAAKGVIVKQLNQLNSRNQLHISVLPLYEKFVEAPDETD